MRELKTSDIACVFGGELQVSIGTDGINASGSLTDWGNAAHSYGMFFPLSGVGIVGIAFYILSQ